LAVAQFCVNKKEKLPNSNPCEVVVVERGMDKVKSIV
jgi:hypothetical protein